MLLVTAGELAAPKKLTKQLTKKRQVSGNNTETFGISTSSGHLGGVDKPGEDEDYKAKIRTLPNFHIAVHFQRLMEEYSVIWNNNVLFGENKHCFFKKIVLCTNHRKSEQQLLLKEAINHTIKTGLHGAFLHTDSQITLQLYHLEKHYLHFLKGYTVPKASTDDNKDSVEDKIRTVAATPHHIQPAVRGQLTATYLRSAKLSLKLSDMCHPGFVYFMRPAMTAYGVKASHWGKKPLYWYERCLFTSLATSKRIAYHVGNYIKFTSGKIVLIQHMYTHAFRYETVQRLFVWCQTLRLAPYRDKILEQDVYRATLTDKIVHLASFYNQKVYIIPVTRRCSNGANGVKDDDDNNIDLLYCNWMINFL